MILTEIRNLTQMFRTSLGSGGLHAFDGLL